MSHDSRKDEMMVAHICQTLNEHSQQAHDFDQTLQQLAEQVQRERQQRLQKNSQRKKWWYWGGSIAIAASVTLLVFSPQQLAPTTATAPQQISLTYQSVEPQMLEDMEMLMLLGEEQ